MFIYTTGAGASARYSRAAATPKALRRCQVVEMCEDEDLRFILPEISARCSKPYILRDYAHKATTDSIESSARKTRIYFLKGTKMQGNNKTLRCGHNVSSLSRQLKVMPPIRERYLERSRTKIGEATTFCTASSAGKTRM